MSEIGNEQEYQRINKIPGLDGMSVNERLFASGLMGEFDKAKNRDKNKAKNILRLLKVDEQSISK